MHSIKLNEKEMLARSRVCLPLDNIETMAELEQRVVELSPVVGMFKIGKGSFTKFAHAAINAVQDAGAEVFLDLKYYDIPATMKDAGAAAAALKVYMFNVHAHSGYEAMKAARIGAEQASQKYGTRMPKILGVTVLTSFNAPSYLETLKAVNPELEDLDIDDVIRKIKDSDKTDDAKMIRDILEKKGLKDVIANQVFNLAQLSNKAGLDGIVCSAADLYAVNGKMPKGFMYVTPGIEGTTTKAGDDQARVFSPGNALLTGSTILVVGRAITTPETPELRLQAGYEILKDMARYL